MSGWTGNYDTPTISDGPDKPLPQSRVRDGWHGHAIYRKLEYDDRDSELARANIDYQIDGGAPYSPDVMKAAGRGEDANVNFREARAEDDLAQTPFIEMGTVSSTLWRIKTSVGNLSDRKKWNAVMSEKFTKMVRKWGEDFDYYRIKLAQQFTRHGAGFAYWENEIDWRWRSDGLNAFKLPRNTESRSSAIPYCVCKRSMTVDELYAFIRDEESAKAVNRWNVDAVKLALRNAAVTASRNLYSYAWEDFLREIKENDVEFGVRAEQIQLYHLWVREYNGQFSHYIGLQDSLALLNDQMHTFSSDKGSNNDKEAKENMVGNGFLYTHRFRFPAFNSCIVPFFYAVGTHATIHTIRGQGEMNFAPIQISNRAMCNLIDTAKGSSMILLQTENVSDAENFAYVQVGPYMLLPANAKVQPNAMPDVSSRMLPVLDQMRQLRSQVSPNSSAQPPTMGKSKQPETKYSVQAKQNRGGALSSAMLTQWFGPFGRLGAEMYRRVMNPDLAASDPGGELAFWFRKECMLAGVPVEAMKFENVEVTAERVIGNGSPEQRQYASEQVLELSDGFDEVGKKLARRDCVASIPGVDFEQAELYVGEIEPRQPVDEQIANNENSLFTLGAPAKATGEQNHWVHCQVHMEIVREYVQNFDNGQIDGASLVKVIKPALDNMLQHSQFLSKDKTHEKESAEVRKFIQQNNGILEQQENKMIAEMHRQQEQATQQRGGQAMSGDEQRKWQLHQMEMQKRQDELNMRRAEYAQKLQEQHSEALQRKQLADMEAARQIAERNAQLASEPVNE